MSLEQLQDLVTPPAQAATDHRGQWAAVEAELGTTLPGDYQGLIETYGVGHFNNFVSIFSPFTSLEGGNLLHQRRAVLDTYHRLQRAHPDQLKLPAFPAKGGLLPCGTTDNGDTIFWHTRGAPDAWSVVVLPRAEPQLEQFDLPLTSFLAGLLSGGLHPRGFPGSLADVGPRFTSWIH